MMAWKKQTPKMIRRQSKPKAETQATPQLLSLTSGFQRVFREQMAHKVFKDQLEQMALKASKDQLDQMALQDP